MDKRKFKIKVSLIIVMLLLQIFLPVIGEFKFTSISRATETTTKTATVNGIEWEYEISEGKVINVRVKNNDFINLNGSIVIPSTINGYSVISIGERAFYYQNNLTSIEIPSSVTSIGDYAFQYCASLTSIEIPSSVTSIGDSAFRNCTSLTSIEIPSSVTSIGDSAFRSCTSLTSIEIPSSVTSIGECAFAYGINLGSINVNINNKNYCSENGILFNKSKTLLKCYPTGKTETDYLIPNNITSIENGAFMYCRNLNSIRVNSNNQNFYSENGILFNKDRTELIWYPAEKTETNYLIPNSVTSIGDGAFYKCTSLTSIEIPSSVTSIGECAFRDCTSLTSIEIPSSVTSIGDSAFYKCTSLTSIEIPSSVTSIGKFTFFGCTSLTSIEIPSSVTSIGFAAFQYCASLTSIEIPSSVTSIGYAAFRSCTSLTSIEIPSSVTSIGECAFGDCTSLTSIEIPSSVTSIGDFAFQYCASLTSIEIPSSVTSIGDFAFHNCESLSSIEIPSSVTSIGVAAFQYCASLTSIEIPSSVTSIGKFTFFGCTSLTSIEIPSSVTSIGEFAFYGCSNLTIFGEEGSPIQTYASNNQIPFSIVDSTIKTGTVNGREWQYEISEGKAINIKPKSWYSGQITIPSTIDGYSVTSIGFAAFHANTDITSVTIPDSVTSIGEKAFKKCTSLTSITIPGSVATMGNNAFEGCTGLQDVIIRENSALAVIGDNAFKGCTNLKHMYVSSSDTQLTSLSTYGGTELTLYGKKKSYAEVYANSFDINFEENAITGLEVETMPNKLDYVVGDKIDTEGMKVNLVYNNWRRVETKGYSAEPVFLKTPGEQKIKLVYLDELTDNFFKTDFTVNVENAIEGNSDFKYIDLGEGACEIVSYEGTSKYVGIPRSIAGLRVVSIGSSFGAEECEILKIPETVIRIKDNALVNSKVVVYLGSYFSDQLQISTKAFGETIPATTKIICMNEEDGAYGAWNKISGVAAGNFILCEYIGNFVVNGNIIYGHCESGWENIHSYYIDNQIPATSIYPLAFYGNTEITSFDISNNSTITSIGARAFEGCTILDNVQINNYKLKQIGERAFYGCSGIKNLNAVKMTIPQSTQSVGAYAFEGITNNIYYYATNEAVVKTNYIGTKTALTKIELENISYVPYNTKTLFLPGETVNPSEMVITSSYNNGVGKEIKSNEYTYSPTRALTSADEAINVSYTTNGITKTVSIPIQVENRIVEINVTTPPTDTVYLTGENFDPTGMEVTATYLDGSTRVLNPTEYTYKPSEELKLFNNEVEINLVEDTSIYCTTRIQVNSSALYDFVVALANVIYTEAANNQQVHDNVNYTHVLGRAIAFSYVGEEDNADVAILDSIDGNPVEVIGNLFVVDGEEVQPFSNKTIKTLKLPNTVTGFDLENTLQDCENIVIFSTAGVDELEISEDVFGTTTNAKIYCLPSSGIATKFATIPGCTVVPCTEVNNFMIDNKKIYGFNELEGENLAEFNITNSMDITDINGAACFGKTEITKVDVSENTTLQTIGGRAFANCTNLDTLILKENLTIGDRAFANCAGLTSLNLKDNTSIGKEAFADCSFTGNIFLPDNITSIGKDAFKNTDAKIYYREGTTTAAAVEATTGRKTMYKAIREVNTIEVLEVLADPTNTENVRITINAKDGEGNIIENEGLQFSFGDETNYSSTNTKVYPNKAEVTVFVKDVLGVVKSKTFTIDIDLTKPTIRSITPNNGEIYAKAYTVGIEVTDEHLKNVKYVWLPKSFISATKEDFNQETIGGNAVISATYTEQVAEIEGIVTPVKTGKYKLWVYADDEIGNYIINSSGEFYLDNKVDSVGKITATAQSGGIQKEDCYLASTPISLKLTSGADDLSGHKSTTYVVYKVENGTDVLKTTATTLETIISEEGQYKAVITTLDNLDNSITDTINLKIDKNGTATTSTNIEFGTNGNSSWAKTHTVPVSISDFSGIKNVEYAWSEEATYTGGEYTQVRQEDLSTVNINTPNNVTGKYYLHVRVTDLVGNITRKSTTGNFFVDNAITTPAELKAYLLDENGNITENEYVSGTWVNTGIYVDIKQGDDKESGYAGATYTIKDSDNNVIAESFSVGTKIFDAKVYSVIVTSKDNAGNTIAKNYTLRIDNAQPTVNFVPQTGYGTSKSVVVNLSDIASGIDTSRTRYMWTRSIEMPTEEDFNSAEDSNYKGSITGVSATIKSPENESGIWFLWILAFDNSGNRTIRSEVSIDNSGNISYIDNTAPQAGTIKVLREDNVKYLTTLNEEIEKYEGIYTNKSLIVELFNGYDADSGVKTNVMSVKKNGQAITVTPREDGKYEITEDGIYEIVVTTTDNVNLSTSNTYLLKVDKSVPTVTFNPNQNTEYAKQRTVNVVIEDTLSGVNTSRTKYYWKVGEQETAKVETTETNFQVETPEGKTGRAVLYVYAEDNCGNGEYKNSGEFYIDNTPPTKAEIEASIKEIIGTIETEIEYFGEITNKDVTIKASEASSLSGVDKYQYTYTTDAGETWSTWADCDEKGKHTFTETGTYVVKVRGVSIVADGENAGIESDEFVIIIDKVGPAVVFENTDGTGNGSENWATGKSVKITLQDPSGLNNNSLKYAWLEKDEEVSEDTVLIPFTNGEPTATLSTFAGEYKLYVVAKDSIGNVTEVYSNIYKVDTKTPETPTIVAKNAQNVAVERGELVNTDVTVEISGASSVSGITYFYKMGTEEWKKYDASSKPVITAEGITRIKAKAVNGVGKESSETTEYIVTIDKTPPDPETPEDDVELEITSEEYTILENKKFIVDISPNTKAEDFVENIVTNESENGVITILDSEGNEIKDETTIIGTGAKVKVQDGEESIEYFIVVNGDVTGDGKVDFDDIIRVNKHRLNKITLQGAYAYAADVNKDNVVTFDDIIKINKYRLNKISSFK